MRELPASWTACKLGDVCSFEMGQAPPGSASNYEGRGTVFVKVGEFGQTYPVIREWTTDPKKLATVGDILICVVGATVGKLNLAIDCAIGRSVAAIKPSEAIFQKIVYFQLLPKIQEIRASSTGSAQGVISREMLRGLEIVLSPFNEQKRITDKLDQLLTAVDSCKTRLDAIPGIIKRFRQSVLAAATSGELTADWRERNDIASYDIPSRLSDGRHKKWSGRGKYRLAILSDETESTEFSSLPDSWYRGTLDQITWSVKDGPHFSPNYADSGIPFISGGSIKPGKIDLSIAKFISSELHQEFSARCKPEYLDVLYTKGGTTGLAAVNTLQEDFNVWVHVAVLKLLSSDLVNPFFVQHALNSPDCYVQSQRYTHGVGNQDLGLTRMIKIVLPVPPIEEQNEIVRRVESLLEIAYRLEARYQSARSQVDQLTPSLLAKAFRGELVPQDPNDEPAEKLLERILSAKAVTPAKRQSSRNSKQS